jgi:GH15 family glucan-1,4-alpha-glucosidase
MQAPIGDYALLSDCQGSALVRRCGSIDWACLRRFDAPSTFARLLDDDAGHWSITPSAAAETVRAYLDGTMVLRSEHSTNTGRVAVTDALVFEPDQHGHQIGQRAPHALARLVEGVDGDVELDMELAPRPEYGLTVPLWQSVNGGAVSRGGSTAYVLSAPVPITADGGTLRSRFRVRAGQRVGFALHVADPWQPAPTPWTTDQVVSWLDGTIRGWQAWSKLHQTYAGPYADLVHHSGRVLQALTYAPTGAIIAAPTTSLPETIGGPRNWDYRYAWVRDASLTLSALWVAACPDEVGGFFEFFLTAAGGHPEHSQPLQILYGVRGERRIDEVAPPRRAARRPVAGGTSSTRSSCAGSRWTGRSGSATRCTHPTGSRGGAANATRSGRPSSLTVGATALEPSSRRSAATTWTRRR